MANTQAIDQILKRAVDAKDVPGVVALAATDRGIVYEGAGAGGVRPDRQT